MREIIRGQVTRVTSSGTKQGDKKSRYNSICAKIQISWLPRVYQEVERKRDANYIKV